MRTAIAVVLALSALASCLPGAPPVRDATVPDVVEIDASDAGPATLDAGSEQ